MREKNIVGKDERQEFLEKAYAREVAIKQEFQAQEDAKSHMEKYIERLEADLLARGVTDETVRLTLIMQ